jgi:hypothetical protein
VLFDGPRSPEQVAAVDRAGRERIIPALSADPDIHAAHRGTYLLQLAVGS